MSFVYAENITIKNKDTILIHSDTKIGLLAGAKAAYSDEEIDLIKKYGMVKISILGATISIAFAGNNVFLASKLFSQLYALKKFSVEEILGRAYAIHNNASSLSDIEFLICSADDNILRIDCIKEGMINKNCQSAWIGSYVAFEEFQRIRLSDPTKRPSEMTDNAFQSVVQGCKDDSVGGFCISVNYDSDSKCFRYSEKSSFYTEKEQIVKPGEEVRFFLRPSDGGFSWHQMPCDYHNLLIRIDQMESMILYSSTYRVSDIETNNPNLFGLMLPMLVEQNEKGIIRK